MTVPLALAAIAGAAAVIGALAFAGEWLRHRAAKILHRSSDQ